MEDTPMTATMKANRIHMFGGPEVILFEDVPRPTPGTGDYAVQFARAAGAHVIASVLPRDRDEALRLGADEVISIPSEEAQGLRGTLDRVIDTVGGKAQRDLFAYVRKGGTLISSVSAPDAQLAQQCGIEAKYILVDVKNEDLKADAEL